MPTYARKTTFILYPNRVFGKYQRKTPTIICNSIVYKNENVIPFELYNIYCSNLKCKMIL